ncbi:MAG: fibronectin type III domain-containing protein, partial [Actinomycetota bacterium]|nr:fibronectin type III domain-containing protein [Actinomycetota bacterium]
ALALAATVAAATVSATAVPSALAAFHQSATATATLSTDTLAPPTDLTAGVCLLGSVTLSWTATPSTWADGYEVRWGTTSGGPYPNSATALTTSHAVTGLSLLTTYHFVVRASDGNWRSSYTNQVSVLC